LAEIASAHEHARTASRSTTPPPFETLDAVTAAEIEAIAAQIIPSSGGPGAREAGVIFFIDRALSTFESDKRDVYRDGMAQAQQRRKELFPDSAKIASLTNEQQITLAHAIEHSEFFELLRTHTILGFLGDPSYGGNRESIGWKHIGFEDRMSFQPPFGYYDAHLDDPTK
jgi:gluconate 2-dehydrogenase gamma chain